MTIKIVLPSGDMKAGYGTKVYTDSGDEIKGVTSININIDPNSLITATMTVIVSEIENLSSVVSVLSPDTIKSIEQFGYTVSQ